MRTKQIDRGLLVLAKSKNDQRACKANALRKIV